jgi:phosphoribosyl-AMP cyclohydrolase
VGWWKEKIDMEIDFGKMQGLAPAVIQDDVNGDLLMVGFMNREALETTLRTGFVTFYSRTRQKLWTKGETSGNRLEVVAAWTDCDRDTVLLKVRVLGEGKVCHTGSRSCFTKKLTLSATTSQVAAPESKR